LVLTLVASVNLLRTQRRVNRQAEEAFIDKLRVLT
jgi:hypothetical protein